MNCKNCKVKKDKKIADALINSMYEKKIKHLRIAIIVLSVVCAFLAGCLIYEKTAYEVVDESYFYTQDGDGNNIMGDDNYI